MYTKAQILDAFCQATGYNPEKGTKTEHLQAWVAKMEPIYQKELAKLKTPTERAKSIGLDRLLKLEKEAHNAITLLNN